MQVRPTSTSRTHRGKRITRGLMLGGPAAAFALLLVAGSLAPTAGTSGAGEKITLPDGSTRTLVTAAPMEGTTDIDGSWYYSVLAKPSVLGDKAPKPAGQVSNPRVYSLASDKDPQETDGQPQVQPTSEATEGVTYKQRQAQAGVVEQVRALPSQVAAAWMTYSAQAGERAWADGVREAARTSGVALSPGLDAALDHPDIQAWKQVTDADVTSQAGVYDGRKPSAWVSDNLSRAVVNVVVARTSTTATAQERKDFPIVSVTLEPTGRDTDGIPTGWHITTITTN